MKIYSVLDKMGLIMVSYQDNTEALKFVASNKDAVSIVPCELKFVGMK